MLRHRALLVLTARPESAACGVFSARQWLIARVSRRASGVLGFAFRVAETSTSLSGCQSPELADGGGGLFGPWPSGCQAHAWLAAAAVTRDVADQGDQRG